MAESKKILVGFVLIVFVVVSLGLYSQWQLSSISQDTDDLYQHPFTVSNAAKNINFNLVSMHRYMKDVVLAKNEEELLLAVEAVAVHEEKALSEFNVIFDRFLGDRSQINKTYRAFNDWKTIRIEVIQLMREGKKDQAIEITKGKGAVHVGNLNLLVEEFVSFAFAKAKEFHSRALSNSDQAMLFNLIFSFTALLFVFVFVFLMRKSLLHAQKDRNYRNHLIDQNIMLATLDKDGVIEDVSSALCRFLGNRKKDLIGKASHFFDNSDDSEQLEDEVLSQILSGKEWQGEIKHYDHKGEISWANSKIVPQYDEDYNVIGFINILVSITSKKLSGVDKLTSMLNRRRYDEIIVHEMRVARRNEQSFTLVVIDIDFFKKYNDRFGHPQGDVALQKVSEEILTFINRPTDYAFRIGGEEFAVIFSNLDVDQSKQFMEKIKVGIEDLGIDHPDSTTSDYITASFGACVMDPNSPVSAEQLYIEADKALYSAKEKRNTIVVNSCRGLAIEK
jgi:diguanylate cyclase (GGDEF)-like protein/PAS domain S-box-containing protein